MTTGSAQPIIVNVLTGFLGAGKTTLLNGLLSQPDLSDVAVIINEFGSIGLDHLLVETIEEDTVLLQSGCICCTIRGDLKQAILSLFEKRKSGRIAPFTRLIIETTGLADPAPIVATLTADLMLKYHFSIGNIITVVDVPNGRTNIDTYVESARQVAVADRLVITKTDIAGPEATSALIATLSAMNPMATIEIVDPANAAANLMVTEDIHNLAARPPDVRRWIAAERYHDHAHAPVDNVNVHGAIRAVSITTPNAVSWPRFSTWLSLLVNRHGNRLLRVKGIIAVEGHDTPVVIHGVQHLIHRPVHLAQWPGDERGCVLVFIIDGDIGDIPQSFTAFVDVQSNAQPAHLHQVRR
ncbi:cobalamin biosynthesis protein CobW [Agrobacterium rubi]|uniref:CobW family GTP-binding protein n=1 Tax=Agrobacterium rubi TaxID=28099 RepID=UPI00201B8961|nr:GTP-binding protein [Agrobacterium rubi]MCL6654770.1 cobalamin biosynthesis protein CobW [Agrobacterium rubi]